MIHLELVILFLYRQIIINKKNHNDWIYRIDLCGSTDMLWEKA